MNTTKKILIVEDNEENMDIMARTLEKDYRIIKAFDGQEALAKIINEKPDLVLLDILLPIMDGLLVTKKIRQTKEIENIPIVAISASAFAHNIKEALEAGCNDFIPKPVRPRLLRKKVAEYLT